MWTFIGFFAVPLVLMTAYAVYAVVREGLKNGLSVGLFRRALTGMYDPAAARRDRFGLLTVLVGGFFFFSGYWIALFSLFASAYLMFFIGTAVLVVGMVVALRPVLKR